MYKSATILIIFGLVACFCATSQAGIVLDDPEMWTNSPALEGWTNAFGTGSITNPGTGGADGASDGYLQITFTNPPSGPPMPEQERIYTFESSCTGSYRQSFLAVSFDFLASNALPATASIQFHNPISDRTWGYAFEDQITLGSWSPVYTLFDYDYGNTWSGGTESQFWDDLANVDWIGVRILQTQSATPNVYGIDNWQYFLFIPEPGSTCMLGSALLSLAVTLRRKKKKKEEK